MKQKFAVVLATAGVFAACADTPTPTETFAGPQASVSAADAAPDFVPGEVLVKFRAGATAQSRGEAMRAANAAAGDKILTAAMRRNGDNEGVTILRTSMAVPAAVAALRASGDVEYAEPNYIYQHNATSND